MSDKKYKILLVEDAKIAQKMASVILFEIGCEVDVVETGKQAVTQIMNKDYDLIFMDLGLPDIDGFSTTEAIRKAESKTRREKPIPIIALTVHEGEHVEITCLDTKMNDFLVKPLTEQTARQMLKKYVTK